MSEENEGAAVAPTPPVEEPSPTPSPPLPSNKGDDVDNNAASPTSTHSPEESVTTTTSTDAVAAPAPAVPIPDASTEAEQQQQPPSPPTDVVPEAPVEDATKDTMNASPIVDQQEGDPITTHDALPSEPSTMQKQVPTSVSSEASPSPSAKEPSDEAPSSPSATTTAKDRDPGTTTPNATTTTSTPAPTVSESSSPSTPARNSNNSTNKGEPTGKGAQIFMNRFQSLKERANQNAQTLWSKGPPVALSSMPNAKAVQERAGNLWKSAAPTIGNLRQGLKTTNKTDTETTTASTSASASTEDAKAVAKTGGEADNASTSAAGDEIQPNSFSLTEDNAKEKDTAEEEGLDNNNDNDDEDSNDDDYDRDSSVGGTGSENAATKLMVGRAFTKASLAASVAYESVVSTGFRGRYNASGTNVNNNSNNNSGDRSSEVGGGGEPESGVTDTRATRESQTELILKSRVGQHMQAILDQLEPYEYAMLLGRGMLGVNLKQCYLKHQGVFIDFLVPGGQAESSGVVRSGDLPVRLGELDLRKGTILDIPQEISKTRRPVVLTLATGTKVPLERMNYLDVAVAMMHRARDYYTKRGTLSNLPSASSPLRKKQQQQQSQNGDDENDDSMDIRSVSEVKVPPAETIDSFLTPPAPTLDIRREFMEEVPKRCLDKFIVEGLCQVQDMDSNFREAVRNAFLTCALDGRRLPFLSRHFSSGDEELVADADNSIADGKMTPSAQLMLFLELTSFLDLHGVTPTARLREMATRIAYKFFLPTTSAVGNKLQPPLFDFHKMVPDASLRHLELVLNAKTQTIPRDIFFDFAKAVVDSLTGTPFISFLTSSECSRMRGYLRNTAPYFNLPLKEVVDGLTTAEHAKPQYGGAKNCFAYILLFLVCQVEKEPAGEYNFGNEPETKHRLLGASNDLCCTVFIRRTFLPALQAAKAALAQLKMGEDLDADIVENVVKASQKFWGVYISGTMELSSRMDEMESHLSAVHTELERVAGEVMKQGGEGGGKTAVPKNRKTAEIFVQSKLVETATTLADEMLYHYASNVNAKFREHKFHEWMCNELSKLRAKDPTWNDKQEIPFLPQGCVKRLLRKADLPEGVSSHKPFRKPTTIAADDAADSERKYPNAEFAVIFGSAVGTEIASEMPVPGIESSDIRRYTCLPVALDREHESDASFSAEDALPPTFEGYAIVPPQNPKPFARKTQGSHFSKDGWEVSLVSFTIPNAESSGADSALYGVSLFLQCQPDRVSVVQDRIDVFVHDEQSTAGAAAADSSTKDFQSPISLQKTETTDTEGAVGEIGKKGFVKNVSVTASMSAFNDKLKSTSWVSRVLGEEFRDPSQPISIGLALVSRKNAILAMRDTLSRLLFDYSRGNGDITNSAESTIGNCGVLVDVLGNFAHRDVESISLKCILEPYLRAASAPWIERPISSQAQAFESLALRQVADCLPPTPLALMFITALLEQKIILSSSRRSILQSATVALSALLDPLKWSHLLVPMVPASLAGDLIQYPAPFILGIPSEESQNAELIGNLPRDVTLVDLDVGRVILAPEFGLNNDMVQKAHNPTATAGALRSQVLYLAQALGTVFGNSLTPDSWLCDVVVAPGVVKDNAQLGVDGLKLAAKGFVSELLEGVSACCYWIEEAAQTSYGTAGEPTVLFDEDKFFEIKNHRTNQAHKPLFPKVMEDELALDLADFDLVLESFLRCQSMSTYISSRPKTDMVYY